MSVEREESESVRALISLSSPCQRNVTTESWSKWWLTSQLDKIESRIRSDLDIKVDSIAVTLFRNIRDSGDGNAIYIDEFMLLYYIC